MLIETKAFVAKLKKGGSCASRLQCFIFFNVYSFCCSPVTEAWFLRLFYLGGGVYEIICTI